MGLLRVFDVHGEGKVLKSFRMSFPYESYKFVFFVRVLCISSTVEVELSP